MKHRKSDKATFAEVIGSVRFPSKQASGPAGQWLLQGFSANKCIHTGEALLEDNKLVRSSN